MTLDARDWLQSVPHLDEDEEPCCLLDYCREEDVASLGALLRRVRKEALEEAAGVVEAELAKLRKRWSLDSAYLSQAIAAIRALARKEGE